jgi:WD40 repeat protein
MRTTVALIILLFVGLPAWQTDAGKRTPTDWVFSAEFDREGTRIVTVTMAGLVRIWDANSGKKLAGPATHEGLGGNYKDYLPPLARFSPDGRFVVSMAVGKNDAIVWNAKTLERLRTFSHDDMVWCVEFSPDGKFILTGSNDKTARVWDVSSGKQLFALLHDQEVGDAQFSADGTKIVTTNSSVRVWSAQSGKPLTEPLRFKGRIFAARFSPDGSRIVTTSEELVQLWDADKGTPIGTSFTDGTDQISWARFSPDGKCVLALHGDLSGWGEVTVYDADTHKLLLKTDENKRDAGFSPDGQQVVVIDGACSVEVWDVTTGDKLGSIKLSEGPCLKAQFSPDGRRIMSVSSNLVDLWDVKTRKKLIELKH